MLTPKAQFAETAVLDDPWLHRDLFAIQHGGVDAFLVGLAAFQRGLQVTYHYEIASKSPRFSHLPVQGFRGELLSISDGQQSHFFRRTLGDLTSRHASARAEDKPSTKALLRQQGISVPAGIVVDRHSSNAINAFTRYHPRSRFLLKPLNGSLGQGVVRNIAAADVTAQVAQHAAGKLMLEEHVVGREYRVFVSGTHCVAAFERCPASVMGDSVHSISALWAAKQQTLTSQAHPVNSVQWPTDAAIEQTLAAQGRALTDVPASGERVQLSDLPSRQSGADLIDATEAISNAVQQQCVRVAALLELPNTGLDIIVKSSGKTVFLEANQSPMLAGSVVPAGQPGHGNRVAESVVDVYFPASLSHPRFTRASFDFNSVCAFLKTSVASSFTLPILGAEWVHQRLLIDPADHGTEQKASVAVRIAQYRLGIHVRQSTLANGALWLDILAPRARYAAFAKAVGGREVSLAMTPDAAEQSLG